MRINQLYIHINNKLVVGCYDDVIIAIDSTCIKITIRGE